LGIIFTEDRTRDIEMETRVQRANALGYQIAPLLLRHLRIKMALESKVRLINVIFIPTLTSVNSGL
ncbi:unnamed protein product, partial [Lymnaea stagnalis]